jgi:HK97 gp10 family phage protein
MNDVTATGFAEIEAALLSIADGEVADAIQREALKAAAAVIKPVLVAETPVRTKVGGKDALPPGALKAAVRSRVSIPKDSKVASATVDFGKLTHIARFVDRGHANPTAKRGLRNTPAHPFVRETEAATRQEATEAYFVTLQAGITKALEGKK